MTKNIYEILNNSQNIELEEVEEMTELEKKRYKKNFKNRNRNSKKTGRKILAASLALLIVGSQTNIGSKVYAGVESQLNNINYSLSAALNRDEISQYSDLVNKYVEKKDIAIKLTDVVIDKDGILVSSLVDLSAYENKDQVNSVSYDMEVFIDGKNVNKAGSSGFVGLLEAENLYSDVREISIENTDLEKELDIRIVIDNFRLNSVDGKKVSAKWVYEFKADGMELAKDTMENTLDYEFSVGNSSYRLEKLRYNKVNQIIYGRQIKAGDDYDLMLKGEDNLGREVEFYLFEKNNKKEFKFKEERARIKEDAEYIILRPYGVKFPEKSGRLSNDFRPIGEEFRIDL